MKTSNIKIEFDCGCKYESGVMYSCNNHGGYVTRLGMAQITEGKDNL